MLKIRQKLITMTAKKLPFRGGSLLQSPLLVVSARVVVQLVSLSSFELPFRGGAVTIACNGSFGKSCDATGFTTLFDFFNGSAKMLD